MDIGIFGSGMVGQTLAEKLVELGHKVMIGTRDKGKLLARSEPDAFGRPPYKDWHKSHSNVELGTLNETAEFGELLINAMKGDGALSALKMIDTKNLSGKVMIDISNPLDFSKGFPPLLSICNTDSLGEQIQRAYPDLKVVKSLNTMNAYLMVNPRIVPEDQTVFLCGNDSQAKELVKDLLLSFGWKESEMLDLGDISNARGTEQLLPIWTRIYSGTGSPIFNFRIVFGNIKK